VSNQRLISSAAFFIPRKEPIMSKVFPVKLTITSRMADDTFEQTLTGVLQLEGMGGTIAYSEESDGGQTLTNIVFSPSRVSIARNGAVRSHMAFEEGTPHTSVYEVPPYAFDMEVTTHTVLVSISIFGGRIHLEYDRLLGGESTRVIFDLLAEIGGMP
jgi:uncharacterized beta-barrel protein YwiB (DUF1934 family)